jgi:hypothetical protein
LPPIRACIPSPEYARLAVHPFGQGVRLDKAAELLGDLIVVNKKIVAQLIINNEEIKGVREEVKGVREEILGTREDIGKVRESVQDVRQEVNSVGKMFSLHIFFVINPKIKIVV